MLLTVMVQVILKDSEIPSITHGSMYSAKASEDEQIIEKNVFKLILHSMVYNSNVKKLIPIGRRRTSFSTVQNSITISTTVQWEQSGQCLNSGLTFFGNFQAMLPPLFQSLAMFISFTINFCQSDFVRYSLRVSLQKLISFFQRKY